MLILLFPPYSGGHETVPLRPPAVVRVTEWWTVLVFPCDGRSGCHRRGRHKRTNFIFPGPREKSTPCHVRSLLGKGQKTGWRGKSRP